MADKQPGMGVRILTISEMEAGQRLDNFLLSRLKGVPRSHIYRLIRKGQVRVNRKRVKAEYRLVPEDAVRIPPVRTAASKQPPVPGGELTAHLNQAVLFENDQLLILNKPAGMSVHGGTGIGLGLIEALRQIRAGHPFLELVHRLDKETSGCLMVAKHPAMLKLLGAKLKRGEVDKRYHAIVCGQWPESVREVGASLLKQPARGGERRVEVSGQGKSASTLFGIRQRLGGFTLLEAVPLTGRTHQIRVHAQFVGHPIAGDAKYCPAEVNRMLRRKGFNRLYLHARSLAFELPGGENVAVTAPYDEAFDSALVGIKSLAEQISLT